MTEYEQVYDGQWWDYEDPQLVACCSCGLVHRIRARLRKGRLQLCFDRDEKETRRVRRKGKR